MRIDRPKAKAWRPKLPLLETREEYSSAEENGRRENLRAVLFRAGKKKKEPAYSWAQAEIRHRTINLEAFPPNF